MDFTPDGINNNRILIVDDNELIHEEIKSIITGEPASIDAELSSYESTLFGMNFKQCDPSDKIIIEYKIDDAYQGEEAVVMVQKAASKNRQYALIFMDLRMPPGINGIEAIERIWRINPFIEIIICTALSDRSWEEMLNRIGPAEHLRFVKKPFNHIEIRQLTAILILKWNMNERARNLIKNMENEMEQRSKQLISMLSEFKKISLEKHKPPVPELPERDGLTKLYTLFSLQQRLQEIFEASRRHSFPLSILIIDIDNFKELNDMYGHETGDEALQKTAELLKGSPYIPGQSYDDKDNIGEIRKFDIAGRYGGDEFAVILPHCSEEQAISTASRLLQRIQAIKLATAPEALIRGNCGIAVLDIKAACRNSRQILSLADKALYYAKSQGKNRLHVIRCE